MFFLKLFSSLIGFRCFRKSACRVCSYGRRPAAPLVGRSSGVCWQPAGSHKILLSDKTEQKGGVRLRIRFLA